MSGQNLQIERKRARDRGAISGFQLFQPKPLGPTNGAWWSGTGASQESEHQEYLPMKSGDKLLSQSAHAPPALLSRPSPAGRISVQSVILL